MENVVDFGHSATPELPTPFAGVVTDPKPSTFSDIIIRKIDVVSEGI